MLRVEADGRLAALQNIAEQELEQVALALAGVAQNQDAGGGLILGAAVQVHDDVGAVAVPAHIEALGVGLAGVVEGVQVGHRSGGQHPFELGAEGIEPRGVGGLIALPLAQQQRVRGELGAGQLGGDKVLQRGQLRLIRGTDVEEYGAVDQRLPAAVHLGGQGGHVLEVALRRHGLLEVAGVGAGQAVFVAGVLDDLLLLGGGDLPGVDGQVHPVPGPQAAEQGQLLRGGGVPPQGQEGVVPAAGDGMVGVELHHRGGRHVQEVLGLGRDGRLGRGFLPLHFLSHGAPPPHRQNRGRTRKPCPAGSRRTGYA